jgi:glycogen synthase
MNKTKLNVLLYSHFFYPSIGGLETVSLTLAEGFVANGLGCKVLTTSDTNEEEKFPFEVIRNPGLAKRLQLIKWADVILFNGATMALQPWVLLYNKPFVWVHIGYQVSCLDGLGWIDGQQAPIRVVASIKHHIKLKGIKWGMVQGFKLVVKRFFAKYLVTKNIAITRWMLTAQPLPRQLHIYNPFPINQFLNFISANEAVYDFVYLGRIVSEKGVFTLLTAFAKIINEEKIAVSLLLIGDGQWRDRMETLANDLKISNFVNFAGKKTGTDLVEWLAKGRIAVVPSEWYEPMGGVVLELMAAGKNLIVSEFGGLKECVGNAGLTFPNGNYDELAWCMIRLLKDKSLQEQQKISGKERIKLFDPTVFISQYVDLLTQLANK